MLGLTGLSSCYLIETEASRDARSGQASRVNISLHLTQRDRPTRQRSVRVRDGVEAILPALVCEAVRAASCIAYKAVPIGSTIDPLESEVEMRPQRAP